MAPYIPGRKNSSRKAKTPRPYLLHKPRGLISQRVQAVGPEHFGVVCVDCAKGSSKYFLADFYGHMRIEPTVVHHTRGDLQAALDRLREKTIKGKRILVKHLAGPSDGRDCQIIFICVSEKERLPQILETLKRTRVLTVGETAGFAEEGGIANLIAERNRVRLEINNSAASRSGLTISSQLLNVATLKDS